MFILVTMKIKLFVLSSFIAISTVLISQDIQDIERIEREYYKVETDYFGLFLSYLLPIGVPLLWLIAIVMILKTEFKSPTDKLIWVLISFVPLLGPMLFFFIGQKQNK